MKKLLFIFVFFLSTNVFSKTFLLNHEGITLGDLKEDVLKKIQVYKIYEREESLKNFSNHKIQYTEITDATFYEIDGIKFTRYLRFEEDRLLSINLSTKQYEFNSENEILNHAKKLIFLFNAKGKKLNAEEPIIKEKILENQGQVFAYVGDEDNSAEVCFQDSNKSKETSYTYEFSNSRFILTYVRAPCLGLENRFSVYYDFNYNIDSKYILNDDDRKIKKSKL